MACVTAAVIVGAVMVLSPKPASADLGREAVRRHSRRTAWLAALAGLAMLSLVVFGGVFIPDDGAGPAGGSVGLAIAAALYLGALALGEATWPQPPSTTHSARLAPRRTAGTSPRLESAAAYAGGLFALAVLALVGWDGSANQATNQSIFGSYAGHSDGLVFAQTMTPAAAIGAVAAWSAAFTIVIALTYAVIHRAVTRPAIGGLPAELDDDLRARTARRAWRGPLLCDACMLGLLAMLLAHTPSADAGASMVAVLSSDQPDATEAAAPLNHTPLWWVAMAVTIGAALVLLVIAIRPSTPLDWYADDTSAEPRDRAAGGPSAPSRDAELTTPLSPGSPA